MKLCIIDNETTRQRNLRSILASLGYKSGDIETFDDENVAVNNLKKKTYNLLFIYEQMPKVKAVDLVKDLKGISRLKSLPIIVYSNEVTKDAVLQSVQAGANGFLGYPFSVSDVESALKVALGIKTKN